MDTRQRWKLDVGARPTGDGVQFRVWAPRAGSVAVRLVGGEAKPFPMEQRERGYFEVTVPRITAGARYTYSLDGDKDRPDPASRFQPDGVHKPSQVVDPDAFPWTDQQWRGLPQRDLIIYELHVGTFTKGGTFPAIIPFLDYLKHDVGITAIELMPVAQCPGARNWGYDGAYPYAVQSSYGGPDALKQLVDACHAKGLAVVIDVVYNHLGPEGNYLGDFGPYFTDKYRTPWGTAINYDGPESDEVRRYMIDNAVYWISEYHIDALRLDAIHGIFDFSAYHILRELNDAVHAEAARLGRTVSVIAESDLNDVRVITPPELGGYGLDGQWNDDFHHAIHGLVTGEREGYYADFGGVDQVATALREGFVLAGTHSVYRRRRHGNSSRHCPPSRFVVFAQNHDQVGNRAYGDRLSSLVPDALHSIAATVLLAPSLPLVFMGEEYGETAPFQYFVDHGDPGLIEAVRKGRREEFAHFGWTEDIPDPVDPQTFERSRVHPGPRNDPTQQALLRWTKALIDLRKRVAALGGADSDRFGHRVHAHEREQVLVMHRWADHGPSALVILGYNKAPATLTLHDPVDEWHLKLEKDMAVGGGSGRRGAPDRLSITRRGTTLDLAPYAAVVYLNAAED